MAAEAEFTTKEVAAHNLRQDCWMTIRGEGKLEIPRGRWQEKCAEKGTKLTLCEPQYMT